MIVKQFSMSFLWAFLTRKVAFDSPTSLNNLFVSSEEIIFPLLKRVNEVKSERRTILPINKAVRRFGFILATSSVIILNFYFLPVYDLVSN